MKKIIKLLFFLTLLINFNNSNAIAEGSSELLKVSKKSPEILRNNVTSKGGTTEAALNILNNNNFEKILKEAVFAAKKKSEELSKD